MKILRIKFVICDFCSEFEAIAQRIRNSKLNREFYNLSVNVNDNYLTLNSYFEPIDLSSMNKGNTLDTFLFNPKSFEFLKEWKKPNELSINLPVKSFSSFLPKETKALNVGDTWEFIPIGKNTEQLSNNRYEPPDLDYSNEIILFKIIQMFHKNVFLHSRFPPTGLRTFFNSKLF